MEEAALAHRTYCLFLLKNEYQEYKDADGSSSSGLGCMLLDIACFYNVLSTHW